jgi:hypothetical protein
MDEDVTKDERIRSVVVAVVVDESDICLLDVELNGVEAVVEVEAVV